MNRRDWKRQRRQKRSLYGGQKTAPFKAVLAVLLCIAAIVVLYLFALPDKYHFLKNISLPEWPKAKKEPEITEATPSPTMRPTPTPTPEPAFDIASWKRDHIRVRGIYVTGPVAGSDRMEEILEIVEATELNALVIDIKNDEGAVTFKPEGGSVFELETGVGYIRDIGALMERLKERNIYTIARIACFKDPMLAKARPELQLTAANGRPVTDKNGLEWVNPCNEEVWEYLTELGEMAADLGFDEIQYDYVRFPVGDEASNADFGEEVTSDNKHEYIAGFLTYATKRIHEKGIPVTADVFGTIIGNPVDAQSVGQDYAELAGIVDALCPMVYPSHYGAGVFNIPVPDAKPYDTVLASLTASVEELSEVPKERCAVVRPWLQAFTATWVKGHINYDQKEIRAQIDAVKDAGYEEWILWNAKNNYEAGWLAAEAE
ncbi:MAG: putative glycoside hydrolase [Lachnospiraceae bacterium]|nr:putative glycoside hydrolase [Lachnospiraceae bacterium]